MANREKRDSDDAGEPAPTSRQRSEGSEERTQLRLVGERGRPLTKAQKKFDQMLRRVETLRAERARLAARWDKFVKAYQERIHPEERRMIERRKQVARLLAEQRRKPKGLGKQQREHLDDLLLAQLRALAEAETGPERLDEDLRQLWAELHPESLASHDDETWSENASEATRTEASSSGKNASDRAGRASASPDQNAQDEGTARGEEPRKRTVVSLYKQLAKVLHPDLEQDPAIRQRKQALMQELTRAYREGDLPTLLRLELEWARREERDLARLGEDELGVYSEVLAEQIEALQAELRDLPFSPRFAAVSRFVRAMGEGPPDVDSVLLSIRRTSEALKRFRDELTGPEARAALRAALEVVAAQRRESERWGGFGDGF